MRVPSILVAVISLVAGVVVTDTGCATVRENGPPHLATIDVRDPSGQVTNLSFLVGKVVVIDVCAAWADACLRNAAVLTRACDQVCGPDVQMLTILLDDGADTGAIAMKSYLEILDVHHPVYHPGPRSSEGGSALGDLSGIPRLLIFDRDGFVVDDISGAVIGEGGLLKRVDELR